VSYFIASKEASISCDRGRLIFTSAPHHADQARVDDEAPHISGGGRAARARLRRKAGARSTLFFASGMLPGGGAKYDIYTKRIEAVLEWR